MQFPDARSLSHDALHERRRQVVRLHLMGGNPTWISELTDLSYTAVRKIIGLYQLGGAAALEPATRGRRSGQHRLLSVEQERLVRQLLAEETPAQFGCKHWSRDAVTALIAREMQVALSVRTVGRYMQRWGVGRAHPVHPPRTPQSSMPDRPTDIELQHEIPLPSARDVA